MRKRIAVAVVAAVLVGAWGVAPASAYMCEGLFKIAEERIKEAEGKITPDTDVRIKQKLVEAKGVLETAKVGHRQATERHTGPVGPAGAELHHPAPRHCVERGFHHRAQDVFPLEGRPHQRRQVLRDLGVEVVRGLQPVGERVAHLRPHPTQ